MILTAILQVPQKFKFHLTLTRLRSFSVSPNYQDHLLLLLKECSRPSQIHAHMIKTGLDLITFPLSKLLASSILETAYARSIFDQIKSPNLFIYNTMLRAYSISEDPKQALILFNSIRARGISLDQFSFITTLKACARELAVRAGQCIHGVVIGFGFEFFVNVRNTLLRFYCACGRVGDAHHVFDEIPHVRDVVSWNTLLSGYLQASQRAEVVDLFRQMHRDRFEVSGITVMSALSASGDLAHVCVGESLHSFCIKNGFCLNLNVATAVLSMYAKLGFMDSARRLFGEMPNKDVVSWNCIIDGYARSGHKEESMALLQAMKSEGVKPNSATLVGLLSTCASAGALGIGQCIHEFIEEEHMELNADLGTALIDMYSKCGLINKAVKIFNQTPNKDTMCWTAMIVGFGVNGQGENAVQLFHKMVEQGVKPNEVTFLVVLNACSHGGLVMEGKKFFESWIRECSFSPSIEHYGCMIDLLGRAGLLEEAHEMIKNLPIKSDATAWRALLAACRVHGNVKLAEIARRALIELDNTHPTDSILMSSTYALVGRSSDVAKMKNWTDEVLMRKEAGWSSIEMEN